MITDYAFGLLPYQSGDGPPGPGTSSPAVAGSSSNSAGPPCLIVPDSDYATIRSFSAAMVGCRVADIRLYNRGAGVIGGIQLLPNIWPKYMEAFEDEPDSALGRLKFKRGPAYFDGAEVPWVPYLFYEVTGVVDVSVAPPAHHASPNVHELVLPCDSGTEMCMITSGTRCTALHQIHAPFVPS